MPNILKKEMIIGTKKLPSGLELCTFSTPTHNIHFCKESNFKVKIITFCFKEGGQYQKDAYYSMYLLNAVLWICLSFNVDPDTDRDPAIFVNADPDVDPDPDSDPVF
jgi:hypothetical protein